MPINFGILQNTQASQPQTQVIQTAPQGESQDSGMMGLGGVLKEAAGLLKSFGPNPVSQANSAVSQSMANSSPQSLAASILPSMAQKPQQQSLNGSPGYNNLQEYQELQQRQQKQQQSNGLLMPKQGDMSINQRETPQAVQSTLMAANSGDPMKVAATFLGDGRQNHAEVVSDFLKKSGDGNVNIQTTPWCAGFANAVLKSTGHGSTGSLAARSFLNYGTATDKPSQGDVVVFSDLTGSNNSAHGHVGFYAGEGDQEGMIKVLGGNQSGSVSIKEYPASKVIGYRVPPSAQEIQQRHMQQVQQQQMQQQQDQSGPNYGQI